LYVHYTQFTLRANAKETPDFVTRCFILFSLHVNVVIITDDYKTETNLRCHFKTPL